MIEAFIDGLCEPYNPNGVGCWGIVIYKDGKKQYEEKGSIGMGKGVSNNVAEYTALCRALKALITLGWNEKEVVIKSDSQLVVMLMSGQWRVKGGLYLPRFLEAKELVKEFKNIRFVWIPREENEEADRLSRLAYEKYCSEYGIQARYHGTPMIKETEVILDEKVDEGWVLQRNQEAVEALKGLKPNQKVRLLVLDNVYFETKVGLKEAWEKAYDMGSGVLLEEGYYCKHDDVFLLLASKPLLNEEEEANFTLVLVKGLLRVEGGEAEVGVGEQSLNIRPEGDIPA